MPRDEDKMNINLNEYGDCIVVRGVYRETGHLSVVITDLENNVLAQISKDLPNASTLSQDEIYFDSKKYSNLSAQLLALPEFTKTTRRTKTANPFDDTTYYIWKFTGA
jgi:hypothetical protein